MPDTRFDEYPKVIFGGSAILSAATFSADRTFEVSGPRGRFVSMFMECDGATHLYTSKVSPWKGYAFEGKEDYPLTFKKVKDIGYMYLCGCGEVTLSEGESPRRFGFEDTLDTWLPRAAYDDPLFREGAAQALGCLARTESEKKRALKVLIPMLQDKVLEVRRNAAESLGKLADPQVISALRALVGKKDSVCGLETEAKGLGASDFSYTELNDSWVSDVASAAIRRLGGTAEEDKAKVTEEDKAILRRLMERREKELK